MPTYRPTGDVNIEGQPRTVADTLVMTEAAARPYLDDGRLEFVADDGAAGTAPEPATGQTLTTDAPTDGAITTDAPEPRRRK